MIVHPHFLLSSKSKKITKFWKLQFTQNFPHCWATHWKAHEFRFSSVPSNDKNKTEQNKNKKNMPIKNKTPNCDKRWKKILLMECLQIKISELKFGEVWGNIETPKFTIILHNSLIHIDISPLYLMLLCSPFIKHLVECLLIVRKTSLHFFVTYTYLKLSHWEIMFDTHVDILYKNRNFRH